MSVCPIRNNKWSELLKEVGKVEAYRLFVRNGSETPDFGPFTSKEDVVTHLLNEYPNRLSKYAGDVHIKTGGSYATYLKNISFIRAEIPKINKLYNDLLSIQMMPITKINERFGIGRTKAAVLNISQDALDKHYSIYDEAKERAKEAGAKVTEGEIKPLYEQRVDYNLRIVDALDKIQRNKFEQSKLQGWLNDLQKQGVPKEQLDLFKDFAKDGMTKDEIISSILANYSYTVEINTPLTVGEYDSNESFRFEGAQYHIEVYGDEGWYYKNDIKIDYEQYEKARQGFLNKTKRPTQYYSNLTVSGGTNYTESEIKTPDITPSIKGHAQFSTDQGIGWFRSDDKETPYDLQKRLGAEIIVSPDIYTKTRRILEIQSDLFQKSRGKENLITSKNESHSLYLPNTSYFKVDNYIYNFNEGDEYNNGIDTWSRRKLDSNGNILSKTKEIITEDKFNEEFLKFSNRDLNTKQNKFLQLLNKDNNWVTFFIKSIIQDSAKKGYEKVLFPKGETAAKIEGHETITEQLKKVNKTLENLKNAKIKYIQESEEEYGDEARKGWELSYYITNNKISGIVYNTKKEAEEKLQKEIEDKEAVKKSLKTEGIEKLKPVEAFYEIRIQNILKKLYPDFQRITDEYNNEWFEVTIKPERDLKNIQLQREDKLTPENRVDFEKKKAIMLKKFPKVKNVIEDYNIVSAGLLEADGTTIRVNPNKWTTDTIGHEFGHVLIDMLGGMNNPMIREARNKLIGHPIEKRILDLYPDLVEANDERLDKEIVTTAVGIKTDQLFKEDQDRNWWERFLMRLFDRLKRLLGIEKEAVTELAKMVVGQTKIPVNDEDMQFNTSYEQRVRDYEVEPKENISKVESLRRKALESLEKKYTIYRKKSIQQKAEALEDTLIKLEDLKNDPIESLKAFQDFAIEETNKIYEDYSKLKRRKDKGEQNVFNARTLSRWKDYVSGFNLLEEIIATLRSPKSGMSETEITKLGDVLNLEKLTEIVQRKNEIQTAYIDEGIDVVARFLLPYSTHITAKYKEIFEREYNKLPKSRKKEISVDDYIAEQIATRSNELQEKSNQSIKRELVKAYGDINQLMRWLDNVLDSPDLIASSMVKAFAEADRKSRLKQVEFRNELLKKLRALEKFQKNKSGILKDDKKFYDFLIEKDDKGNYTSYIVDVYKNTIWEEYKKYADYLQSEVEANRMSFDEMVIEKRKWKNLNSPLRYTKFLEAKYKYIQSLVDKGLVTKEQLKGIKNNDNVFKSLGSTPQLAKVWKRIDQIVGNEAAELISEWLSENSRKFREPTILHRFVFDEKKKKLVREDKGWYNLQWNNLVKMAGGSIKDPIEIQRETVAKNPAKDPRIDFYNFIIESVNSYQKLLPFGHRLYLKLPSVMKDFNQRLKAGDNIADILKGTIKKDLSITSEYEERGDRTQLTDESNNAVNFLPVYFTGNIDIKNQSFDIADVYFKYISMAIDFSEKNSILPEMEMTRFFINNREVITRDSKGNVIKDAALKLMGKERTESGVKSLIASQLNDWFESIVYGQRTKDEGKLNILGTEVDFGRAIDLVNRYTALNLLGANFIQGAANVILGSSLQTIEAFGKQYYSSKNLAKANSYYFKNMAGLLGDIGLRAPENIVNLLNEQFDILNEYVGGKFRKNSKFRQLLNTNTLFFTSHAGEHYMQTKLMLAMLDTIKAKDNKGNVLGSMLDTAKVKEGKLVFEGKGGEKVVNFGEKEQFEFEGKVKRLLSRLHGEYSDLGRVAIQRLALGRMAYMFRKFIVPGWRRRYGKKYVNNFQGEFIEGNYRTFFRFVGNLLKDLKTFQLSLMSEDWKDLTRMEKANVKRTLGEVVFLMAAIIMGSVFIKMKGDTDDEEWLYSFLGYQALRFRSELGFFFNPQEAMRILRSPAASMSVIENTITLFGQLIDPLWNGDLAFERYERGNWKGRPKINKTLTNFVPGMKQIYRLRDVEDQISWFKK